ncbi:MAG: DUF3617 family protein [Xanthobacteraceae bacterium]|jgi:hypothetical protein
MKWIFLITALVVTRQALAADLPSRKPGLWEIKTTIDGRNPPTQVIKQCIDAATDQMTLSIAGPFSPAVCPKREIKSSGDSITVDSTCTIGKSTATAHAMITGNFESAYTMTVKSEGTGLPAGTMMMTIDGSRLGDCTPGQKPGDIIFGNGRTVNILEAQKHIVSPNDPLLPSQSPQQ